MVDGVPGAAVLHLPPQVYRHQILAFAQPALSHRVAEEAVQTKAAHSIENREVYTEAMAEVLAKQGMRERARAVYEKLSLLNPDKRAYFAAKIEQLNIF